VKEAMMPDIHYNKSHHAGGTPPKSASEIACAIAVKEFPLVVGVSKPGIRPNERSPICIRMADKPITASEETTMSENDRDGGRPTSTEELGFRGLTNYRAPSAEGIQAGINAAMADVIRTANYIPNALGPPNKVTVAGAVPVKGPVGPSNRTGWRDPGPLSVPTGQDVIERLVNAALPHSSESPLRKKPGEE
jgi:hypothetical protein